MVRGHIPIGQYIDQLHTTLGLTFQHGCPVKKMYFISKLQSHDDVMIKCVKHLSYKAFYLPPEVASSE